MSVTCGVCRTEVDFFQETCGMCDNFPTLFFQYKSQPNTKPVELITIKEGLLYHLEDPDESPEWNSIWHSHLVGVEIGLGQLEEARKHAEEFLRLQKQLEPKGIGEINATAILGLLCTKENRFEEAQSLFKSAMWMSRKIEYSVGEIKCSNFLNDARYKASEV